MAYDPAQLPLIDLGLSCKDCGYPLLGVSAWRCPECGREFDLEEYIPDGAMPPLFADGEEVRASPRVVELLQTYRIAYTEVGTHFAGLYGGFAPGFADRRGKRIRVDRNRYFEAIDLLRRQKFGEPMPAPPRGSSLTDQAEQEWTCPGCGETNPGTFEVCWNCMRDRGPQADG